MAATVLTTSDSLSIPEIKWRSIHGAKWTLLMNGLGVPVAFAITLMLGRVGPSALGTYALVQVLIGVISTLLVYGGQPVLSVFLPTIVSAGDRGRFFTTYATILLSFMIPALLLLWTFPSLLEFFLQRTFDMRNYCWFILMAFTVVTTETAKNAASGLMLIKLAAIARQIVRLALLAAIGFAFFIDKGLLLKYSFCCIMAGFMAGYLIAGAMCLVGVIRDARFNLRLGWFLPVGFWSLSAATTASAVLTFVYVNFDRMAVFAIQDVAVLGTYQAVLSVNHLIWFIPSALANSFVPMFSSLLATGDAEAVRRAYTGLQHLGSVLMTVAALGLISYSVEVLSLFGDQYVSHAYLLILFAVTSAITAPCFGNTPVLIAYRRNGLRLGVSTAQMVVQIAGTLCFAPLLGVLAVALFKAIGQLFEQGATTVFVIYGMRRGFSLPRSYGVGVALVSCCAIVRNGILPAGTAVSTVVFIVFLVAFLAIGKVGIRDLRHLAKLARRRRSGQ